MIIKKVEMEGILVISPETHFDERGFFMESYRMDELEKAGIKEFFVQDNHSLSKKSNIIRGLNFQWDKPMSKIMRVTRGAAFLVAVDIRKNSPTFGKWFGIESNTENNNQLYAEAGFARGFQTLSDECEVQYKCSAFHNPKGEGSIVWNDPNIGIDWPIKDRPILSEKSQNALSLDQWILLPESDNFKI